MRALFIVALLAGFATAAIAQTDGTPPPASPPAKSPPPATSGMGATPDAPVGHRQPNAQSLPPRLRQRQAAPIDPDPFGPLPKICDGC
jgi:hypothetical protein